MRKIKYLIIFGVLFGIKQARAQGAHGALLAGDAAYDKKNYQDAEKQYRKAADFENGNPQAIFNLGDALFQQGKFEDAGERFKQAVVNGKSKTEQADALHNLGDALTKQHQFKEAIQAYEQSLRLRPGDAGTKQNLQTAKKKLKEEQEQKQKQQQQQNQQQQNQEQNQQQQNQEQNQQDKSQQNQNQSQSKPQDQQQQQQGGPQKPRQSPPKTEQQLRKEEAKRLLETAIGTEDRKNARKYRAMQQESRPRNQPRKDW